MNRPRSRIFSLVRSQFPLALLLFLPIWVASFDLTNPDGLNWSWWKWDEMTDGPVSQPSRFARSDFHAFIFDYYHINLASPYRGFTAGTVVVRDLTLHRWFPTASSLLPLAFYIHYRLRDRPPAPGLCPKCSYDLRAHRPGQKCPECGTPIPQTPSPKPS